MTIEERLAELSLRFGDVYGAGENMSNEFYSAMDLALQLAGLLREAHLAVDGAKNPSNYPLLERIEAMLDGEGGGDE